MQPISGYRKEEGAFKCCTTGNPLALLIVLCTICFPGRAASGAQYVGSLACQMCHPAIYGRWKKTPMANVVRDPREHPDAILPDLSLPLRDDWKISREFVRNTLGY